MTNVIIISAIAGAAGLAVGIIAVLLIMAARKDSAVKAAEKIRREAEKEADHIVREARVSAKSDIIKMREECENELKERRKEQQNI